MEAPLTAPAPTNPVAEAERLVIDAAIMWGIDKGCSSALVALEDAIDDLLRLRQERRQGRAQAA